MTRPGIISLVPTLVVANALVPSAAHPSPAAAETEDRGSPPTDALTLAELKSRHVELNGRIVRVRGFLPSYCGGYDCRLSSSPGPLGEDVDRLSMSIGPDDDFDRRAQAFPDREVILTVRLDNACLKPGVMYLDRPATLQPVPNSPIILVETN